MYGASNISWCGVEIESLFSTLALDSLFSTNFKTVTTNILISWLNISKSLRYMNPIAKYNNATEYTHCTLYGLYAIDIIRIMLHHFLLYKTPCLHDDFVTWNYIPRYWPFVKGNHRSPMMPMDNIFFVSPDKLLMTQLSCQCFETP